MDGIKSISIFFRQDNVIARGWNDKIVAWLKEKHSNIKVSDEKPDAVLVLGGDGTILEAARRYQDKGPLIVGLNLGHVGFLASVRDAQGFLDSLDKLFKNDFFELERMMIKSFVLREGKEVFSAESLNDVIVQNLLGMVELKVEIEGFNIQNIRGTGILISTSTGSTAFNLSSHGPIIMPNIKCMIITEILDHNVPTPSVVVKHDNQISIEVLDFRQRDLLRLSNGEEPVDVVLVSDGENVFPLKKGDIINITKSSKMIRFAEFEKNYFFKSLKEKFGFN